MNEGEKVDKFVSGLKFEILVEFLKSVVSAFEEASQVGIQVDSAICGAKKKRRSSFHVS